MLVGIVAKLRNGHLLRYRMENKLTQKAAAKLAGVGHSLWCATETMRFADVPMRTLRDISDLIGVTIEDICPPELRAAHPHLERVAYREVDAGRLLSQEKAAPLLTSGCTAKAAEQEEIRKLAPEAIEEALMTLSFRERSMIKAYFGLGCDVPETIAELASRFNISRARANQIVTKALCKLQKPTCMRRLEHLTDSL